MITQDLSRRSIAISGESVSTYPHRPKAEAFSNAVDVVEHLRDPSTERTTPPCSAHVQRDDVPRAINLVEDEGEFREHDGAATVMMKLPAQALPKHYNDMTKVEFNGGGHRTWLNNQLVCLWGAPSPIYKEWRRGGGGRTASRG